jgi:alpha-glucosidase
MGLGLSGLAFSGPDIGGFEGSANGELLVRWTQIGAFLPFFRNHAALLSPAQEPWAFGEPYLSLNRAAIELRYRLLPYLYTAVWQCAQSGLPIVRPLLLAYPDDPQTHALDDQFLCGDALLVAPVCEPGATARQVYLPAGRWYDFWSDELHIGPETLTVAAPLDCIPLFVRAGAVVPHWPLMQHTGEKPVEKLILHVYAGAGASQLYEDDGHSTAYASGEYRVTSFECRRQGPGELTVAVQSEGPYRPTYTRWEWVVHGLPHAPERVLADGQPIENLSWDEASRTLRFESGQVQRVELS